MKMQLQPQLLQGQQQLQCAYSTGEGGTTCCTSYTNPTAPLATLLTQDQGTSCSRVIDEKVTISRFCSKQMSFEISFVTLLFFLVHSYQQYSEYNSVFQIWVNTPCCYCAQMKSVYRQGPVLVKPAIKCSVVICYLQSNVQQLLVTLIVKSLTLILRTGGGEGGRRSSENTVTFQTY